MVTLVLTSVGQGENSHSSLPSRYFVVMGTTFGS
jgi:hypothetical protein